MRVYIYVSFLIGADEAGERISIKELLPCVERTATEATEESQSLSEELRGTLLGGLMTR